MQEAFVNICGIPTHIMTWGRWIEESMEDVKEVTICITGNPGLPGFYTEYLCNLHKQLEEKMPLWVIGHLGHDDPPKTSLREVPQLKGNEELFDLNNNIRHKIEFIEKYVPKDARIHLIGHSIGAWMILQMLENKELRQRISKCYLLFPTIERMIESPNGWIFTKIAVPSYWVVGFLIALFNRLPTVLQIFFIQIYFLIMNIPKHFLGTAVKYSKASVVEKVVFLAEDEMAKVRGLPRDIIAENLQLLTLYYGAKDGWVPVTYYNELKSQFPAIDAHLDNKNIDHAFVLRHSLPVAVITSEMIRKNSSLFGDVVSRLSY